MLIGQTVLAPNGGATATYFTPWWPRQGDALTAVIEVLKASGAFTMVCAVETKNQEQSDASAATLGSTFNITSTTPTPATRSGCLELVRYKFTLSGDSASQGVHFRSNAPQWQPN